MTSPNGSGHEDGLRRQKEILQKIFDHLPVMINFFGKDGRIKVINREWERTLGWSLAEIEEQDLDIVAECYPDPRSVKKSIISSQHRTRSGSNSKQE